MNLIKLISKIDKIEKLFKSILEQKVKVILEEE